MLRVQQGVPLPRPDTAPRQPRRKYPFGDIGVGEMFFVPNKSRNTLAQYASTQGAKLGRKFSTRLIWMVMRKGEWVPATETTSNAVQGIGVWREA